jgi:hypothetical protein
MNSRCIFQIYVALISFGVAWIGRASTVTNSLGIELAPVAAGAFTMGDDKTGDWDERPAHRVSISRAFLISVSEITLEQYRQFRPEHDCSFNGKVSGVSWHDAVAFCEWLSKRERKPYRLPTEAEWEYACRGSTVTPFWSGVAPPTNGEARNPWGLKGMHDSVVEWCSDWYGPYLAANQSDPVGAAGGMVKVVRGDKPDNDEQVNREKGRKSLDYHRSANRAGLPPAFGVTASGTKTTATGDDRFGCHRVGFRIVQAAAPSTKATQAFVPFVRECVSEPSNQVTLAPDKPYFRKRNLLPIPPDALSSDEAIAAAGLHPSFRNHNHSPALEVCPNGDLLAVMYTSLGEYEPGVSLMATRLRFGADEWEMPEPMFDTPDVNDHAPLLWTDWQSKRMYFFWGWPQLARGAFPFQWMTSDDSGATWSEVRFPFFTNSPGPFARQPINTALRSRDGTLYVASDAEKTNSVLWATGNDGRTWFDTGGRTAGRHTTFAMCADGAILGMGGKSTDIDGYMPKAISRDGGRTWERSKTPFPALGVNQRPSLLRLRSGRLFFVGDFQKRGNVAPKEVSERGCYVALSDDDGVTWRIKKLPGAQRHERFQAAKDPATLGYSVARQAPNRMIHLITSMTRPCLHFELNEAWILSDVATPDSDSELTRSRATQVSRVETFFEKYPDSKLKARWSGGVADDGRFLLDGEQKVFFENGKPHHEARYHLGRKIGGETWYSADGRIRWHWEHRSDGTSVWTQFWDNGNKKAESSWRGPVANGEARRWDQRGRLDSTVEFMEGRLP